MKTQVFSMLLLLALLWSLPAMSQDMALSNKVASYTMEIELDTISKRIKASTSLRWKNISDSDIDELYFHMYYNAFKNSKSTFFTERGVPEFLTRDIDDVCGWGWTHISSFIDEQGNELYDSMQYVQPDDANIHDQTVLKIKLAQAVKAGSTQTFKFNWEAKIPKTMPRTGYNKSFYFMAQWFPKLGVLEPAGMRFNEETKWNCHQYHSSGEYYSDFGDYDVSIHVPENYTVASSGQLVSQEETSNGKVWRFVVDDVIDFTWTCSPHYVLQEQEYKNTKINFYSYGYKSHLAERYFGTIQFAMAYLDSLLGEYPYPTLSIIDPPIHGMFTGGMEYPTLITSLSFCFFPKGFRTPETLVVHEYIHQYFMQMVATHEVEEPWMDEGITSYLESRILDAYLGDNISTIDFLGFKTGNKKFNRVEYLGMDHPKIASNAIKSWEYKHGGYGEIAYNKAALWLQTLEGLIGTPTMDKILKHYFEQWRFKHPDRYDFTSVVDSVVLAEFPDEYPEGMAWFFEQTLYGTEMCDYAVASIEHEELESTRGFFEDLEECEFEDTESKKIKSTITLYRLEDMKLPVDIRIGFENGTFRDYKWDGKESAYSIVIEDAYKVNYAEVDPERKIYIDRNFNNNAIHLDRDSSALDKVASQLFVRLQSLLEFISFAI